MILKITGKHPVARDCVVCGTKNPFSLKSEFFSLENGDIVAIASPEAHHQSYPGRVHGGIISALLDETVGRAINVTEPDTWGVTAELITRYKKPVPYGEKIYAVGRITSNNRRIFEGEGFIFDKNGNVLAQAYAKYMKLSLSSIAEGEDTGDINSLILKDSDPAEFDIPEFPKYIKKEN